MSDDLTLLIGTQQVTGWNSIRVTRGIERCPSDFSVEMTERYAGELDGLLVIPGDPCQVKLGDDLVITGYVDRVTPSIAAGQHSIRVSGRGKCQDLVDCSAEWAGGQIQSQTVLATAITLAKPYGIIVNADVYVGTPIAQTNIQFSESPWEIIERMCRWNQLLCYEVPDGSLLLTTASDTAASSGFEQGVNVQRASLDYSIDARFSSYITATQSADVLGDIGDGGYIHATSKDPGVLRRRQKFIHCEASFSNPIDLMARADWEASRRFGRSVRLSITTDCWRDSAGALYAPNTLVPINLPALRAVNKSWLVSEVVYRLDAGGTTCDLVIMPPSAFQIGPMTENQVVGGQLYAEVRNQ